MGSVYTSTYSRQVRNTLSNRPVDKSIAFPKTGYTSLILVNGKFIYMESALVLGGVVVSLLVEGVKRYFSLGSFGAMATVVLLSIVGGGAFYFLNWFGLWAAVLEIFVSAGAFYAFILRNIKSE